MNAIENAYTSGVLIYSMDYDPKYAHSLMYDDGYFYNAFVRLYNLQNTDISLTGTDLPVVYCEGIKLSCPAVIKDNTIFFPLEHTVSALGGTTSWSPSEMRISFYGKEISVVGNMVYSNSVNYDASLSIRRDFFCMLVTKEFLNDILGLEVTFDESNNTYEIILK